MLQLKVEKGFWGGGGGAWEFGVLWQGVLRDLGVQFVKPRGGFRVGRCKCVLLKFLRGA